MNLLAMTPSTVEIKVDQDQTTQDMQSYFASTLGFIFGNMSFETHNPWFLYNWQEISVYTLSSTNINQSAPNLVKMYVIIRSRMSTIMDLISN